MVVVVIVAIAGVVAWLVAADDAELPATICVRVDEPEHRVYAAREGPVIPGWSAACATWSFELDPGQYLLSRPASRFHRFLERIRSVGGDSPDALERRVALSTGPIGPCAPGDRWRELHLVREGDASGR